MAFPVVATTNTTADTDGASTVVNMPASIAAGDLLIVFCAHDSATLLTQSGGSDWSRIDSAANGSAVSQAIFAKIAAGGDTLTITGAAQDTTCIAVRITGHGVSDVTTDIVKGTAATGNDNAPNPPNCNPGSAADYLWLETFSADDDDDTTNYETAGGAYTKVAQNQSANSTSSVLVAVARRDLNASSLDPGVMALAAAEEWITQTLAIPPVAAQNYTGDVNEEVTLSEAVAASAGLMSAASEDFGAIGESLAGSYQAIVSTPETVDLSESLGSLFAGVAELAEEPGLSEAMAAGQGLSGEVSEDVGATGESLAAAYAAVVAIDEEPALAEALASFRATTSDASDDVGAVGEALDGSYSAIVAVDEEATLSESSTVSAGLLSGVEETVDDDETLTADLSASPALSEEVTLSEALGAQFDAVIVRNDTVTIEESVEGIQGQGGVNYTADLSETVTLSEALTSQYVGTAAITENLLIEENVLGTVAVTMTLGVAHVAPKYGPRTLTDDADSIADEGFNTIKLHLSPLYATEYPLQSWSGAHATLTELVSDPAFDTVFSDSRLQVFVLNVWTFSNGVDNPWTVAVENSTGGEARANLDAEEAEIYDLAAYLLATYPGKTFVFQMSEADWALLGEASEEARLDAEPPPYRPSMLGSFLERRQRAIERARADVTSSSKALHGVEVNLVLDDWGMRVHRDVLPKWKPDIVGFSSYESIITAIMTGTQEEAEAEISRRLRAAHALIQDVYPGVETYIGEFGWPEAESWFIALGRDVDGLIGAVVNTAGELGMKWCVLWTYRDNEEQSPGNPRGFYVRKPDGNLSLQGAAFVALL